MKRKSSRILSIPLFFFPSQTVELSRISIDGELLIPQDLSWLLENVQGLSMVLF